MGFPQPQLGERLTSVSQPVGSGRRKLSPMRQLIVNHLRAPYPFQDMQPITRFPCLNWRLSSPCPSSSKRISLPRRPPHLPGRLDPLLLAPQQLCAEGLDLGAHVLGGSHPACHPGKRGRGEEGGTAPQGTDGENGTNRGAAGREGAAPPWTLAGRWGGVGWRVRPSHNLKRRLSPGSRSGQPALSFTRRGRTHHTHARSWLPAVRTCRTRSSPYVPYAKVLTCPRRAAAAAP